MKTRFVTVRPDDLLPGFNPAKPPDPGDHWDADSMEIAPEWDTARQRWARVKAYTDLHQPPSIPFEFGRAFEMPEMAKVWADAIIGGERPSVLAMFGPPGTGKSHGASAVSCYLGALWDFPRYVEAPSVLFARVSELVGQLKGFHDHEGREQAHQQATNAKVLVLDDLTRFELKAYDVETIGQLLDRRNSIGVATIVTLNEPDPSSISTKVPPFLASRLLAGQQVAVFGEDRRLA